MENARLERINQQFGQEKSNAVNKLRELVGGVPNVIIAPSENEKFFFTKLSDLKAEQIGQLIKV